MNLPSLLLSTKFVPPRIGSQAISREHLLEKLHLGQDNRLLLITGSAGFGKTTLLAQWRQMLIKDGALVTWLSLSSDDAGFESFCSNLFGSLNQAGLPFEENLLLLSGSQAIASLLINAFAKVDGELFLIIDDFHHATDARIAQLLQAVVEGAPHNLHVTLSSRTTPPLLLGRLRAMGALCEIESAELAFDFQESLAFLKAHLSEGLDLDGAHAIHERTDGWPIGLQLISIALKGNSKKLAKGMGLLPSRSELSAYLSEDVVAGLPVELFEFLQKISILRRFNSGVAAYITETPQAAALIASIEERNLFIQPVDLPGNCQWYRLHPLFIDFLQQRLLASDTDVASLHRRATEWFERAGLVQESLRHALLCEDLDGVVQILGRVQPSHRSISHLSQFMRWLDQVPLNLLVEQPSLLLMGIWAAVLTLLSDKARAWIAAFESVPQAPLWTPQLLLIKASMALQRDDITGCLDGLGQVDASVLGHPFLEQIHAGLSITCLSLMGQHAQARHVFNARTARCLRSSNDELALMGIVTVANAALLEGKVLEAERIGTPVLAQAEKSHGRRSVSASSSAAIMAEVYYELDRVDDARQALANRLDILRFSAPSYMIGAALCYARLQGLQDSPRAALDYLEQKVEHFRGLELDRGVATMLAEQLRIVLACGDWRHAETLQVALDELVRKHRDATPCDAEIMTLAAFSQVRLALARQQPEAALQALDIADHRASEFARGQWRVKVDVLRAMALDALGRDSEAMESLSAAVACGYRFGLVRTLLDEGEPVLRLLRRLDLEEGAAVSDYCRSLLAEVSPLPAVALAPASSGIHYEQLLTRREQEILELLEQSMSNKRIALTLNLSLQTVKWNLKNIFVKLAVSSRYDAIIAARKLKALDA
ncbi:LuxR C-terminal-related transcriptional regulator [Pseudomonas sp. NA-150]|uniref:LuxR C-terminal-related transcriptional regulator n=1 Tax=Pseudomonas sp. NA-150 TaxID=3367525 RepID=UPI0037C783B8